MKKVKFPIVYYLNGVLVADGQYLFKTGAKFRSNTSFSEPENRYRDMKDGWIIDYEGSFIELTCNGKSREWLRPISWIWSFVRSEYTVAPPREITVGELLERVKGMPRTAQFDDEDLVADLHRFLMTEAPDTVVTDAVWRRWPL